MADATPAWKTEADQRTKELTDKLEAGIKDLFTSDKYKDYLKSMSHFHNYSPRNIMLIHQQMPGATQVASFKLWKEKFNRSPKKGEKSLRIYAPIGSKKPETKMMEKLDPQTGAPMLDANGKVIMEEMTALKNDIRFKLVPVFDVSQTVGDPMPHLAEDLTGNVKHYEAFLDTLKAVSLLPIEFDAGYRGSWIANYAVTPFHFSGFGAFGLLAMMDGRATMDTLWPEQARLSGDTASRFLMEGVMMTVDNYQMLVEEAAARFGVSG